MAIFNPQIPDTNDPNWLGWSKSISQPEGDKSTGLAISTAAEGFGDALKLADNSMKSIIEDEIYDKAKAVQSDYQQRLANADESIRNARLNPVTNANGMPTPATGMINADNASILNTNLGNPPLPGGLGGLPVQIDTLGAARANGKLSETDYYARLDTLAKDFRSRYPGYKEYVDSTFQKATGVDPANKYIQSVLGDINSFATNANAARTKMETELAKPEVLGSPEGRAALAAYRAGQITDMPSLLSQLQPMYARNYQFEQNQKAATAHDTDLKLKKVQYDQGANAWAADITAKSITNITLGPNKENRQRIEDYLVQHAAGTGKPLSDPEWFDVAQIMKAERANAYTAIIKQLSASGPIDPKTGQPTPSYVQLNGMEAAKTIANAHMAWFDIHLDSITDKNLGTMHTSSLALEAQSNYKARQLIGQVPILGLVKVSNVLGGPNFAASAAITGIINGLDPVSKTILSNAYLGLKVQPGLNVYRDMPTPDGETFTTRKILETTNAPANPNDPNPPPPTTPAANAAAIKMAPAMVLDKEQPDIVKVNAAKGIFGKGYLDLIKGSDNKLKAFQDATSTDMIKEVKRVSPNEVWPQMKSWAAKEFSSQLFRPEVQVLNTIPDSKDMHITWDDERHEFGLDIGPFKNVHQMEPSKYEMVIRGTSLNTIGVPGSAILQRATSAINHINSGLRPIAEMYKADNLDPNTFLPGLLQSSGIQPNTLPAKMFDPFKARALQYNEENAPPSGALDQFVKNPFQGLPTPRGLENNAPAALPAPSRGTPAGRPKKGEAWRNFQDNIDESFNGRFNGIQ